MADGSRYCLANPQAEKKGMISMNKDLQLLAAGNGVKQWQIAKELDVAEATLCRWLRRELKPEMREKVLAAIDKLAKKVAL